MMTLKCDVNECVSKSSESTQSKAENSNLENMSNFSQSSRSPPEADNCPRSEAYGTRWWLLNHPIVIRFVSAVYMHKIVSFARFFFWGKLFIRIRWSGGENR
jgi:hypothetical protein